MWFSRRFDLQIVEMFLMLWNRSRRETLRRESVKDQDDKHSVRGSRRDAREFLITFNNTRVQSKYISVTRHLSAVV